MILEKKLVGGYLTSCFCILEIVPHWFPILLTCDLNQHNNMLVSILESNNNMKSVNQNCGTYPSEF